MLTRKHLPPTADAALLHSLITFQVKIRLPHASVMTLLFASSSVRQRLEKIMGLTWTHGKNLALFVGGYKLLLEVGRVAKGDKAIQVRVG